VRADEPRPLDWRGFLLTAAGMATLVIGLEMAGAVLVVAAAAITAAILYLLRARSPLLDLRIVRVRTYRATALGGSVFRAVITAVPFLLPLFFQIGFGWTAAQAGLVVIALFAGNIGIKPATTVLMRRFGIRTVMLGSVIASAACLVAMAFLQATTPLPVLLGLLALSGIFRSTGFTTYNTIAFADVPAERMTSANTLMSTIQEVGSGLGVAVAALLVRAGEPLTGGDGGYRVAFAALAVFLVVPAVEAITLPRTAGNVLTGRG
jgi:MFS family permease